MTPISGGESGSLAEPAQMVPADVDRPWTYSVPVREKGPAEQLSETEFCCAACGGAIVRGRFDLTETPYSIDDCSACGTGQLLPAPSVDAIRSFYSSAYYGREGAKFSWLAECAVRLVARRRGAFLAGNFEPGGKILDVGCGRGVLLSSLADLGFEVHGTEISDDAARGADSRAKIRIVPSLQQADFPEDHFDGVVIWHVLEHLPDPATAVREAWRILKPGGRLIIAVPNYSSVQARWSGPDWFHLDPPRHLFHFTLNGLTRLIDECGFRRRSVHHFSLRQNPFGWVQSALNKTGWFPRNDLYSLLQAENSEDRLTGGFRVIVQKAAYLLGMPIGLALSFVTAVCRRGATVHVVAEKPGDANESWRRRPR